MQQAKMPHMSRQLPFLCSFSGLITFNEAACDACRLVESQWCDVWAILVHWQRPLTVEQDISDGLERGSNYSVTVWVESLAGRTPNSFATFSECIV